MTLVFTLEAGLLKHTQRTCQFHELLATESTDFRVCFLQRFWVSVHHTVFMQ